MFLVDAAATPYPVSSDILCPRVVVDGVETVRVRVLTSHYLSSNHEIPGANAARHVLPL